MKRVLLALLLLVPMAAACASSPPREAEPPPAPNVRASPSCKQLSDAAASRVRAVVEQHVACSTDADCETVGQGASCADHCTTSMAREGDSARAAIEADVDANECKQFRAQGCRVESPPCTPPPPAACRAGRCG